MDFGPECNKGKDYFVALDTILKSEKLGGCDDELLIYGAPKSSSV